MIRMYSIVMDDQQVALVQDLLKTYVYTTADISTTEQNPEYCAQLVQQMLAINRIVKQIEKQYGKTS